MISALPAPTKAESLRMDLIVQGGCICCWAMVQRYVPCEVHHLTIGGKHGAPRRGHAFTVGLCCWHHRGVSELPAAAMVLVVGPSYARQPSEFRRVFGDDGRLLVLQRSRCQEVLDSYVVPPGEFA